jgi:ABC-2 type transport system ATP-binding protein
MGRHETAVEVHSLRVRRGGRLVLDDVTCSMAAGTVIGLLGPSGAGKTTLIRAIVGVQRLESGDVTVLGHPAGSPPLRTRLGYVTQDASVYLDLTVTENVRYFAALYGLGATATAEAIATVGLTDARNQLARDLSGGQLSRCSLACALVAGPELLVLDEPTVGQDPALREELWNRFRQLAETGATVIVSSHVMDEATRCDRLLLIREGRIVADGTAPQIMRDAGADDMDQAFLNIVRRET